MQDVFMRILNWVSVASSNLLHRTEGIHGEYYGCIQLKSLFSTKFRHNVYNKLKINTTGRLLSVVFHFQCVHHWDVALFAKRKLKELE